MSFPVEERCSVKYGSVCSGIEAATVAWHDLGLSASWFSEIEKFPSQVLQHHYPEILNLGDMTLIRDKVKSGEVEAPDVLVGKTPCQAFSIAGLKNSLNDDRGQLTLEFVRLADEIDSARTICGLEPAIIVWENVPGVLNTKDNAFGCFWEHCQVRGVNYNRQGKSGQTLVVCLDHLDKSLGESLMLNISELPNDAKESLLSQVLEKEVSPKYF